MLQAPTTEKPQKSGISRTADSPERRREMHPLTPTRGISLAGQLRSAQLQRRSGGLQSTMGNQAMLHMMPSARPVLQTKLTVNEPGDRYEQEADRMAEHVMRMAVPRAAASAPDTGARPGVQRKCSCGGTCAKCSDKHDDEELGTVQRKPALPQVSGLGSTTRSASMEAPAIVHEVLRSPGHALDPATRAFFEPRFGEDFSRVRVHTDASAAESASAVHARAYTVGPDIVFASGQYSPGSNAGLQLLAHELTHTVQQGGFVRRQPSPDFQVLSQPDRFGTQSPFPFTPSGSQEPEYQGLYYYSEPEEGCTSCHPTVQRPIGGPPPVHYEQVTEQNLVTWIHKRVWKELEKQPGKQRIFSILQRKSKELDQQVQTDVDEAIAIVGSAVIDGDHRKPVFVGASWAREYFAKYLKAGRDGIVSTVEGRAQEWLDIETLKALQSKFLPGGSNLVIDDPKRVAQIEDNPEHGQTLEEMVWNNPSYAKVGTKWDRKTIKSIHQSEKDPKYSYSNYLYFELDAYPGIYFKLSGADFANQRPFVGEVSESVYDSTKIWAIIGDCIGKFSKGVIEAVAGIGTIIIDTGAKIVDTISLFNAVMYKAQYGVDVPYTCLSSTCREYEKCTENPKEHHCQTDLLKESLKQAAELVLPIIPLGESAVECLSGSCESCGQVAAMFLPTEEVMRSLHEAIHEAGPKGRGAGKKAVEPTKPGAGANERREPAPKRKPPEKITDPSVKKAVDASAERLHISRETAEHEVAELTDVAQDPANVHEPDDARFDAEIKVSDGKITYKRERNTTIWDRCWNPCERGASVGPRVEAETDAALKSKKKGASVPDKSRQTSSKGDEGVVDKGTDKGGLQVDLTPKQAKRLEKVAKAARAEELGDDTKWGNVSPNDRWRLGRVYDNLLEKLISAGMQGVETTLHYAELTPELVRKLRASGKRVLLTEVQLPRIGRRYDFLEINFKGNSAELIDLAATKDPRHTAKTREGKKALRSILRMEVKAKEMFYTGPNGELLDPLVEEDVQ